MDGDVLSIIFCLFFVYFLNLIILFMSIFLFYFACLVTRYSDMEVNPGARAGMPAWCRIMFANINELHGNLDELTVDELTAASHFDIVFCCETKATRRRHAAELRLP